MQSGYTPRETLELMLGHLGFIFEIKEEERPAGKTLHIFTREPGRLIGRNGKVLDDLQYLLNRILSQDEEEAPRIIVDVENYRQHQLDELVTHARAAAEEVRKTGTAVKLPAMNAFERRIVHNLFLDDPEVASSSPAEPARLKQITLQPRT